MKIKNKKLHRIDFKHSKSTGDYDEHDDYDEIYGKAVVDEGDDNTENYIDAGLIEAYFLNVEDIKEPVHFLLDSISGDHERLAKYFDDENKINDKIRKLLKLSEEDVRMMSLNFLYIHKLKVLKKYRGLGIGKTLMQAMINDYKRDSSLAFLIAAPLQFSGREINDDPSAKESFNNRTEAQSRNKLIKLYESYGFKNIPGGQGDMVAYIGDWFF
tara:strand:+ start:186 stop:827 length:642 start_codon:yes stop_codon:yes gene_type:complete